MNHPNPKIEIIGIGLEGKGSLNNPTIQIIEQATVLVGSKRHLEYFPQTKARKIELGNFIQAIEKIKYYLEKREKIVILTTGDPLFFGFGRILLEKISKENLNFTPYLTSIQLAFNKIKTPWQDVKITSAHGRNLEQLTKLLQQGTEKIAILTDNNNNPHEIVKLYLSLDLPIHYNFWLCENLGGKEEKITQFTQPENLLNIEYAPLNILIMLRQNKEIPIETLPILGLPDQTFLSFNDRPGLMTKKEIRVLILGELEIQPQQTVWDIGAGTGSVSIEIARLSPTSKIYAIEKTAMGISLIQTNSQRLGISNINSIHGIAPEILTQLPPPQRIFIGGSSGKLREILNHCQQKITEDGIIVLALTSIENLNIALNWFKEQSWNYKILQVNISRATPIAQLTRYSPLNPVNIIKGSKK